MRSKAVYSIAEARKHLSSLVRDVEAGAAVELTRRGEAVAVLLSVKEFRALGEGQQRLWPAIQRFRESADLDELDVDEVYVDVRDRSPGRPVAL